MSLTKRQITKASRLYSLAVVANCDLGGAFGDDEDAVAQAAIEKARADLDRLGFDPGQLSSLESCINAVRAA